MKQADEGKKWVKVTGVGYDNIAIRQPGDVIQMPAAIKRHSWYRDLTPAELGMTREQLDVHFAKQSEAEQDAEDDAAAIAQAEAEEEAAKNRKQKLLDKRAATQRP